MASGELLLVLGVDAEIGPWKAVLAQERLLPIFFTLVLIVVLLGGNSLLTWRERLPGNTVRDWAMWRPP